jgi:hypothetical protein
MIRRVKRRLMGVEGMINAHSANILRMFRKTTFR